MAKINRPGRNIDTGSGNYNTQGGHYFENWQGEVQPGWKKLPSGKRTTGNIYELPDGTCYTDGEIF